jgi:hypothetical protein
MIVLLVVTLIDSRDPADHRLAQARYVIPHQDLILTMVLEDCPHAPSWAAVYGFLPLPRPHRPIARLLYYGVQQPRTYFLTGVVLNAVIGYPGNCLLHPCEDFFSPWRLLYLLAFEVPKPLHKRNEPYISQCAGLDIPGPDRVNDNPGNKGHADMSLRSHFHQPEVDWCRYLCVHNRQANFIFSVQVVK